jgi:hypothetical protein
MNACVSTQWEIKKEKIMQQYVEWISAKDLDDSAFSFFLTRATDAIAPLKSG